MSDKKIMVAFDCGNSSFRTVVGEYENGKITTTVISQTENTMVKIQDYYYWDMLYIFNQFKATLKQILKQYKRIDSIGVCTWGVDFALFDKDGHMLSNPLCYRNTIGEEMNASLSEEEKSKLFYDTGILCDKINSVFMLSGMKKYFPIITDNAARCLMVPDIINYFLTGRMINEPSELSTTQLMNVCTKEISKAVCEKFEIDKSLFGEIGVHGEPIGYLRQDIMEEIGTTDNIPVICVASHDTGSAVAAIPATEDHFGFISCGTWSLIGTELDTPVISDDVIKANLTNEVGALGKITLLKNNSGMFIVNHLKKEYDFANGRKSTWDEITLMAEKCDSETVIDLNDIAFFNPVSMSKEIWDYLLKTKQVTGDLRWDVLFKTFYESLACCYALTLEDAEKVTGHNFEKIYIVGGGASSRVLLKLTAQHVGKPIVACYGESTSMGNLALQLKFFEPDLTLKGIRSIIADSYHTDEYSEDKSRENVLQKYKELTM